MPRLSCLYLKGNPVVRKIRHYRKSLITRIPRLSYLDDRPVFDLERIAAPLWELDVTGRSSATLDEIAQGGPLPLPEDGSSTLLAVYCSFCLNPAPKIVGVLVP